MQLYQIEISMILAETSDMSQQEDLTQFVAKWNLTSGEIISPDNGGDEGGWPLVRLVGSREQIVAALSEWAEVGEDAHDDITQVAE